MKKSVSVIAIIVAIIAATYFADRATRVSAHRSTAQLDKENIGAAAPDVSLKDLSGNRVNLDAYKGKVVLVNFWATWCDPCRAEIPDLINIQNKYAAKGFTILGVDVDEEKRDTVAKFVQTERFDVNGSKLQMNYPILLGDDAVADKFGGLLGYPTSVLIGRDGKVVKRITGMISEDDIVKEIQSQL